MTSWVELHWPTQGKWVEAVFRTARDAGNDLIIVNHYPTDWVESVVHKDSCQHLRGHAGEPPAPGTKMWTSEIKVLCADEAVLEAWKANYDGPVKNCHYCRSPK